MIREIQKADGTTLRAIADALNARGVAVAPFIFLEGPLGPTKDRQMERALAEKFIRELSVMGDHLNRLHELIQAHVIGDDLQKAFRKSLGEVMGGAAVMTMHISRFHPDLDPDKH